MFGNNKTILFYNAIPMPHSLLLQELLEKEGYKIYFWYYRNLTNIYPWESLNTSLKYYVYGESKNNLIKLLKHLHNSNLVIITGWHTFIHVFLLLLSRLMNIKVALWFDIPDKPKHNISYYIKAFILRLANFILITGKPGIKLLEDWYKVERNKIKDFPYLYSIVDIENIKKININRKLQLQKRDKIRVFISNRFEHRKGYQTLYTAFQILDKKTLDHFIINISGTGSKFEMYKNSFEELDSNINFLDWLSYEDYLLEMDKCDVFIHASSHEPYGIPPMDAMSRGKLVISSSGVFSCLDRIVSGRNGYIFTKDNPYELANLLISIVNNKKQIYLLGERAMNTSLIYSFNYNLQTIEDVFDSVKY